MKRNMLNLKEYLKNNKKLLFFIILITLFQILMHFFVYSSLYKNFSFFCGDSAYYSFLANNINVAAEDRPSGFPFILHILFYISKNPLFLIIMSVIVSIFTSIFFFLSFRYLFKNKNIIPFIITLFFFLNPTIPFIDSMIYMSDSFSFFLFTIIVFLILSNKNNLKSKYLIAGILFGYLTIVKSAFVYLFPFIILYIIYNIYISTKKISINTLIKILSIFILFIFIPLSYIYLFNEPRLGMTRLENFGGRSAFGNILPHISCDQLLSVAKNTSEKNAIIKNCDNNKLKNSTADEQRWTEDSVMNKIERDIIKDKNRAKGNQLFQRLTKDLIIKDPTIIIAPIKHTILNGYLNKTIAVQLSINEPAHLVGGCEVFVPDLLKISEDQYLKEWNINAQNKKNQIKLLSSMQFNLTKFTNWLIAFLFILFIPFYSLYKKIFHLETIFLYAISTIYVLIVSLGSSYDNRYYIIFNYLVLLTFISLINFQKTEKKNNNIN